MRMKNLNGVLVLSLFSEFGKKTTVQSNICGSSSPRASTSFLTKEEHSSPENKGERAKFRIWEKSEKSINE